MDSEIDMKALDLGCGLAKVKAATGVDRVPLPGVDLVADLESIPYPLADNSFDAIYLNDIIEHLPNTIKAMEEIYRIARPDAHVYIRVIPWSSELNATDPTHLRTFTEHTFDFFGTLKDRTYYSTARFAVLSVRKEYNPLAVQHFKSQRLLKFLSRYLNNITDSLFFDLQALKPALNAGTNDWSALTEIIRCPQAIKHRRSHPAPDHMLRTYRDAWLMCDDPGCERRYPIFRGVPIMNAAESERWIGIPADQLAVPAPVEFPELAA